MYRVQYALDEGFGMLLYLRLEGVEVLMRGHDELVSFDLIEPEVWGGLLALQGLDGLEGLTQVGGLLEAECNLFLYVGLKPGHDVFALRFITHVLVEFEIHFPPVLAGVGFGDEPGSALLIDLVVHLVGFLGDAQEGPLVVLLDELEEANSVVHPITVGLEQVDLDSRVQWEVWFGYNFVHNIWFLN